MLKKLLLAALLGLSSLSTLACCGIFSDATKQAVGQKCQEFAGQLGSVKEGRNRNAVESLLDQCYVDANAGKLGIVEIATLEVKVQEIVADGDISDAERQVLEAQYREAARE